MPTTDILVSPFELAARRFDLIVRRLADDLTYGSDLSRFVGAGVDYAQSRPYAIGDSIRSIDWKVTGRTGRYHVKEYEAPKRLPVYIVVDTSASMGASSLPTSKHALAVWIGAMLSVVAYRRRNPVALISGGDRPGSLTPTLERSQIWRSIDQLRTMVNNEATRLVERIQQIERLADRTSLLVVISDLHAGSAVEAIKSFGQRHDALVIQPIDPAELGRLRAGFMRASEAETGRQFFASGRSTFLESNMREGDGSSRGLAESGIDHVTIRTDQPFMPILRRFLTARGGARVPR